MSSLDDLTDAIAAQTVMPHALETLLAGLADRIKATSNDQNIQRLARDIRAATPALVAMIAAKPAA